MAFQMASVMTCGWNKDPSPTGTQLLASNLKASADQGDVTATSQSFKAREGPGYRACERALPYSETA